MLPDIVASLETEVASHAYTVVVIVGALCASAVGLTKMLFMVTERRLNEKFAAVEEHNREQDARLDKIDTELRRYDKHVAVGETEMGEIHSAVQRVEAALNSHIQKEEGTTWVKIDNLVDAVNAMRLQNEADHGTLKTSQAVLSTRLEAVEAKIPNGDLKKLTAAFELLAHPRRKVRKVAKANR